MKVQEIIEKNQQNTSVFWRDEIQKCLYKPRKKEKRHGNSLVVQWLRLCAFTVEGLGSIPGWGTKILQDTQHGQKKKNKSKKKSQIINMRNETGENENVKAFDKIQNPFMIAH